LHPVDLINELYFLVSKYANGEMIRVGNIFKHKDHAHKKQIYALHVIAQITKKINQRGRI